MTRREALDRVRAISGHRASDGLIARDRIFCIRDGVELPQADFFEPSCYQHGRHRSRRAFIFDPQLQWEFRDDGELLHFAAGVMPWKLIGNERRFCLFRRRAFPVGFYTIPAGHIEQGEAPLAAALRETREETGLEIPSPMLLFSGVWYDECRRGANYHHWHAYEGESHGEPRLSDEGNVIGWFSEEEILHKLKLTRPTGMLFERLLGRSPRFVRAG